MKRFFMFVTAVILIFSLAACGGSSDKKKSDEGTSEVAMIVDGEQLAEGSVDQSTWLSVKTLADENGLKLTKTMIGNRPGGARGPPIERGIAARTPPQTRSAGGRKKQM